LACRYCNKKVFSAKNKTCGRNIAGINHDGVSGVKFKTSSMLRLFHINVRSLERKVEEIEVFLDSLTDSVHILCVSESWLCPGQEEAILINGFKLVACHSRPKKKGGGVCVYLRDDHRLKHKTHTWSQDVGALEVCMTEIIAPVKVIVITAYRPPDPTGVDDFLVHLECLLSQLSSRGNRAILCGDWNYNLLVDRAKLKMEETVRSAGFRVLDYGITRPSSGDLGSAIDFIISNWEEVICAGNIDPGLSDHCGQVLDIPCGVQEDCETKKFRSEKANMTRTKRFFGERSIQDFITDLSCTDWTPVYEASDTNRMYKVFLNTFRVVFEKHFPLKACRPKTEAVSKAWMTEKLRQDCKIKRDLNARVNAGAENERKNLGDMKRVLRTDLERAMKDHHAKLIEAAPNKQAMAWRIFRKLTKKSETEANTISLNIGKVVISEPQEVASALNVYYTSIAGTIIDYSRDTYEDCLSKVPTRESDEVLHFPPVSASDVRAVLDKFKPKTSAGWDDIPMHLLKKCAPWIAEPLAHVFNTSFRSGVFPDSMKYATVRPLFKKGDRTECKNYRPVSLLPSFSKVLEKLALISLQRFLEENTILSNQQYGFRKNRSTTSAIFKLLNTVGQAIERKNLVGAVMCDLTKAFDTMDHALLVEKIKKYGAADAAVDWIASYLSDRKQRVQLGHGAGLSEWSPIKQGVPQGSILGPALFNVYVNDLAGCLANGTVVQFADDTTIVVDAMNPQDLFSKIERTMEELENWFNPNKLSLNYSKTKILIFTASCGQKPQGDPMEIVDNARFLGVILDKHLKWKPHAAMLRKKLASAYFVIKSLSRKCHAKTVRLVYFAQFQSVLQYAVVFWGGSSCTDPIFKLQKKTIRVLARLGNRQSCRVAYKELRILTLIGLYIMSVALFAWDNQDLFQTRSSIHEHFTRGSEKMNLPGHRLKLMDQDLIHRGAVVINKLPSSVSSCDSRCAFKRALKDFLLENAFYTFDEFILHDH
jgi:Reverse transcriptase (RNA-dependent DNA polymerase)